MEQKEKQIRADGQLHITGYGRLFGVILALLILTGITVAVSYVNLGFYNVPIALFIASTKSSLVLLFFMHLKYDGFVKSDFDPTS